MMANTLLKKSGGVVEETTPTVESDEAASVENDEAVSVENDEAASVEVDKAASVESDEAASVEVELSGTIAEVDCWMYGPNGESQVFKAGQEIPDGWQDTPAAFDKKEASA